LGISTQLQEGMMDEELVRVFLVDDDEDDYVLTRDMLAEAEGGRFGLEWVDTYEAALEAMEQAQHDVCLVDYRLGERDGVELLRAAIASGCRAPLIILTGRGDHAVDVAAMKAGAADYLDKGGLSAPLLERSIRYAIERQRAEEALQERVKELACLYAVNHDMQERLSIDELCRRVIEYLIPAMKFPEITVPVIELDGRRFTCERYTEGLSHGLHEEIRVGGEVRGHLSVYYAEKRPFLLPEEQNLLNAIVEDLGLWLEHKEAEEALRESEESLAKAQQIAHLGNWDWDVKNQRLTWSDEVYRIFGVEKACELTYEGIGAMIHPDDREKNQDYVNQLLTTSDSAEIEFRMVRPDGTVRHIYQNAEVWPDEAGNASRIFGIMQDITERKQAEEAVELKVEQLAALSSASQAVTSSLELNQVLAEVVSLASEVVASDYTSVLLVDEAGHMSQSAENLSGVPAIEYRVREEGFTSWIVRSLQALVVDEIGESGAVSPDLGEGAPHAANPHLAEAGVQSLVGLPLVARDRLLGVLYLHSLRPRAFQGQMTLLTAFANQAAIAIENARLYQETQRELAERKQAQVELQQSYTKLEKALEGTIHTLASATEMRDPYTAGHQRRVTQLACAIANEMGLPEEQIEGLRMAGLIHDVGKINVPADILSKPGRLNEIEFGLIKMHPQVGHDILKAVEFPWPVAQIVLQHHERMDGSGYPYRLSGEEITLEARILAVADVVEAMASHRPYRPARGIDEALEEISQGRGCLYDAEAVDACLRLFTEKGFRFE
jgi:PAS domain S-box-containing protein